MNRIAIPAASMLCLVACFTSFTDGQEIRRVAQPNESVRVAHGGYVCEGQFTTSPIDETYDMVTCTGPLYNASDYAALYTKLNHDELVKLNANSQRAINRDLKAAIQKQFNDLPSNLRQMAAIQSLEKSLTDYVNARLPAGRN